MTGARDAAALTQVIAETLDARCGGVTVDTVAAVAGLHEIGWAAFAGLAEVSVPSDATRSSVLTLLRQRLAVPDPFVGYPKAVPS